MQDSQAAALVRHYLTRGPISAEVRQWQDIRFESAGLANQGST